MANKYLDTGSKKTGCRRSKLSSQFVLWIWCALYLFCLPNAHGSCLKFNITVSAYPQGDISIPYGEPLEIYCIAENYTSEDIEFSSGGIVIPSEIINSTTRRLYIDKPEKQVNTYYCKNNKTKKTCSSRVLVDSPPTNVSDFSCISKNLDILNCSWTSSETRSNINYTLIFLVNGNSVKPCDVKRIDSTRYCTWNASSQPRYRQLEETYYFNLVSCNVFGCNEQNFTIDHYSIVKPDPPSDLRVLSNGTHSVTLQWSISNNMADLLQCGVEHRLEYQIAKIDNTTHFRRVNTSMLPYQNKTYRFQLNDLPYAHMQYEVRIYIKSVKAKKDELWSEFSYMFFYTASERPKRPPKTIAGAFHQSKYKSKRLIYVYWQQLEEYEEAGENFTYKVAVSSSHGTSTLYPNKNKSLSYVILEDPSLEAMEVSIWSSNIMGSSLNSSHLYIPPDRETLSLSLNSFTKLAYENGTYKLSWDGIENIDNYTLFWCQHNTTKICTGRLNFTVLDSKKSNHVIDLPRDYRYQFAISVNKGARTSGMVWANCDISKDGIAMYGFPVHLEHDIPGKSFVKIKWSMECVLQDGIITGYNIAYCPINGINSPCDNTVGNKSYYINDPSKTEINITGLLPFRIYQFKIALNTTYGLKTIENASTEVLTAEDTPTSPRNVTIFNIKNDSLVISWDPPLHRNGNIGKYVIYNYDDEIYVDKVEYNSSRRQITLTGLQGYTNYSFSVQACNSGVGLCSKRRPNEAVFVRTRVGPPSKLKPPTVNNSVDVLTWDYPEFSAGTQDQLKFQVKIVRDGGEPLIHETSALSYSLTQCEGGVESETYQVRALNYDNDPKHGVLAFQPNVIFPEYTPFDDQTQMYFGEWSDPSNVACKNKGGLAVFTVIIILCVLIGLILLSFKLYKKFRKLKDIKPDLPTGLHLPEKDITKYAFGPWNTTTKEDKSSQDELLLLPDSKTVSTTGIKMKDENRGSSDHTNSTELSITSQGPLDRQASTSDDGSSSSLHLEMEPTKGSVIHEEEESDQCGASCSVPGSSTESSPYLDDISNRRSPINNFIQAEEIAMPSSGYMTAPFSQQVREHTLTQLEPTSSSYVVAGLPSSIFTTGVNEPSIPNYSSGYVQPQDIESKSMNFPKLGPSPSKVSGPESLPIMPSLPTPAKIDGDSSYIQLQTLNSPSLKQIVNNHPSLDPPASSGYINPGDAVINKHLKNIMSAGQLAEESAILDPKMSPDAYCRFSWSVDPMNDNLHSLLAEPTSLQTPTD